MLEGTFNLNLTKSIRRRGLFCYKTADRFHPGVPDIYIAGGHWIESKVLKVGGQNRNVNIWEKLSPAQQEFGKDLLEAGDTVFLAYRIEGKTSKHLLIHHFHQVKHAPIRSVNELLAADPITSEKDYDVDRFVERIKS